MKKLIRKLSSTKANTILTSLLSLTVMAAVSLPGHCFILFYEPKKPEGINEITLKDLLPKKAVMPI